MTDQAEIAAATAEVKRLKKRVAYWLGKVTALRNQYWRLAYVKATRPDCEEAWLTCETTLSNCLVQADNYSAIRESEVASLRVAEATLAMLKETAGGA